MSTVKECCTEDVKYVGPAESIANIAKIMKDQDCGSVLVGENDKLTGVITDRDIVIRCIAESGNPESMQAKECMSPEVLYCFEDEKPENALKNMADNGIRRLPVLDKDKNLTGIVSFGDLSKACDQKDVAGQAMEQIRNAA